MCDRIDELINNKSNFFEVATDDQLHDAETNFKILLNCWGVNSKIASYLWNLKINIDVLKMFIPSDVDQVFPGTQNYGEKVRFRAGLQEWRKMIGLPMTELISRQTGTSTLESRSSNTFIHKWLEASTTASATSSSKSLKFFPNLLNVINSTWYGKEIIRFYCKHKSLTNSHQMDICYAITEYFIANNKQLMLKDISAYADDIVKLFPTEKSETYYMPKQKDQKYPSGKLYNMYRDHLKMIRPEKETLENYLDSRNFEQNKWSITKPLELDDIADYKIWLHNNFAPWNEIVERWQLSSEYRIDQIRTANSFDAAIKEWPLYKCSEGYNLIDIDFEFVYAGKGNLLVRGYNDLTSKLERFYEIHKKKLNKKQYKSFTDCTNYSAKSGIAALLLNSVLRPQRINKLIKPTVCDAENDFIIHILCIDHVQVCIDKLQSDQKFQPKIIAVGPSLVNLQQFYVYCGGLKYAVPTFVKALDTSIKLCLIFNLKYSEISKLVWMFMQEYFFQISPELKNRAVTKLINQIENLE